MSSELSPETRALPYQTPQEIEAYLKGAQLGYLWGRLAHAELENERLLVEGFRISQQSARFERQFIRAELEAQLAYKDHKTGVLNSRGLEAAYDRLTERLRGGQESNSSVLYLDLDHFSDINTRLGHSVADDMLEEIAAEINEQVRAGDIVGRHGGDEFIVFLCGTGKMDAIKVATKLKDAIVQISTFHDKEGVVVIPSATIGIDEVDPKLGFKKSFEDADQLMLEAKESGYRNKVFWVDRKSQ